MLIWSHFQYTDTISMSPSRRSDSRSGRSRRESGDQYGFSETKNYLSAIMAPLVPQWLAVRGVSVSVTTDKGTYRSGEPIVIDITFANRLPAPVRIETPTSRQWGWTVDGKPAASNDLEYRRDIGNDFGFRAGEVKRIRRVWDGRFKRSGNPTRWVPAENGSHEIAAFIDARSGGSRLAATTTIEIE